MERRREERIETNVNLSARMPARPAHAVIHDISHDGCRMELGHANIDVGGTVLLDLPGALRFPGTIVWVRGNEAGVRFERPLRGAPAIALGLDEPEPEPVPVASSEAGEEHGVGGFLRHWMRRLTSKFSGG